VELGPDRIKNVSRETFLKYRLQFKNYFSIIALFSTFSKNVSRETFLEKPNRVKGYGCFYG